MTQDSDIPALETAGLGRRYGKRWALKECDLRIPAGGVVGLVGPNGAGKSTLLHLAAGLLDPTRGAIRVLGGVPRNPGIIARVGFVAQDKPLYGRFTVAETLRMGSWLNPSFEQETAIERLARFEIPPTQRVGQLSGGQRAQVALALALGKRPDLLLLDEPVANLDPLARRQFLQVLLEHTAAHGMSVILSSHVLADLERACDYLVLVSASRVQLSAPVDHLLAEHRVVTGPPARVAALAASHALVETSGTDRQASALIRGDGPVHDPALSTRPAGLEELVLAYMKAPLSGTDPGLKLVPTTTEGVSR